jgi:hypothetical protein
MIFEIILQFLKQKVIEISKGLFFIFGFSIMSALFLFLFILGSGFITYSLFNTFEFTNCIKTNEGYFLDIISFGFTNLSLFVFGIIIFEIGKIFVNWIKDNWKKAKVTVYKRRNKDE